MSISTNANRGFTLLEVMVAILILAIGLLGLAQLQITSLKNNQSAYFRSQASELASDMFERMHANLAGALDGNYIVDLDTDADDSASTTADIDIAEWLTLLAEFLPDGDGYITCTDADSTDSDAYSTGSVYTITIQWTESHDSDGNKGTTSFVYSGSL